MYSHSREQARMHAELHILDTNRIFLLGNADKNTNVLSSARFLRWMRLRWMKIFFAVILLFLVVPCFNMIRLFNYSEEYDWLLPGT